MDLDDLGHLLPSLQQPARQNAGGERRGDGWGAHAPNGGEGRTTLPWGDNKGTLGLDLDDLGHLLPSS